MFPKSEKKGWPPSLLWGGIIVVWCAYAIVLRTIADEWPGTFGDSFGALNTLFTGLAFAALIVSLRQQGDELKLQREALEAQRQELALQRDALREQRDELARSAKAQQEQVDAMQRTAEAQERAAKAQEASAEAQVRAARVAEAAESLRAIDGALESMGTSSGSDPNWAPKRKAFVAKREELISTITQLTGSAG